MTQEKPKTQTHYENILESVGAFVRDDHFVYSSGLHGDTYVNKDALYIHTQQTRDMCEDLAGQFADKKIRVVVGPVLGGIILSHLVADQLMQNSAWHMSNKSAREVFSVYAEKDGAGGFVFNRGYDKIVKGRKVLIVEDVITTGGTTKKVIELVNKTGGKIVGVGCLVDRSGKKNPLGKDVKMKSLITLNIPLFGQSDCPMCKNKIPVNNKLGKGKEQEPH